MTYTGLLHQDIIRAHKADTEQLDALGERILTADTLEALLNP